jgi:hypothetical protein
MGNCSSVQITHEGAIIADASNYKKQLLETGPLLKGALACCSWVSQRQLAPSATRAPTIIC